MHVINVEIKAVCSDPGRIMDLLRQMNAEFKGRDHQVDTYFKVTKGRLKLREGDIENNLIYYERPDMEGPKTSRCILLGTMAGDELKEILTEAMGVKVVVEKIREIYFIGNIKIHVDEVGGLGTFVEIEAQGSGDEYSEEQLLLQCNMLKEQMGIGEEDLLHYSYSDMIMQNG